MARGFQDSRQKSDSPLMEFFGVHRRGKILMIVDQRLTGKKAGSVSIGAEAAVNDVEAGHRLTRGSLEERLNIRRVEVRGSGGREFALDAMDVGRGKTGRVDEVIFGQLVIAFGVGGWDATLVHPEQMDIGPLEARLSHLGEHSLGR